MKDILRKAFIQLPDNLTKFVKDVEFCTFDSDIILDKNIDEKSKTEVINYFREYCEKDGFLGKWINYVYE